MKRLITTAAMLCVAIVLTAQGVKPLPTLHVEGKWLMDSHGNKVVLHGVMDTPNMYFNGWRWGSPWDGSNTNYNSAGATKCKNYFEKLFKGLEEAKCNVFRLHLDPAWTNDPSSTYVYEGSKGQAADASGEADIKKFNPNRLKTFLTSLYWPLIQKAMNHGMYVVVRPPGVCPGNLQVGDYYQNYLMTVWDIFSKNDSIKKYAGQVSIELANEPVNLRNANGQDDAAALHDYFQPIVDKIRANGFTGIVWVPGSGWQSNYQSYMSHPVEGYNIGYAVHDYCGWYGSSDDTPDPAVKIAQFGKQVPVVNIAPVIITEVDWSPHKPGTGHYNEHGEWVESNYGTWATGSTSKWGKAFKACLDHYENISMTLSGTACLIDVDTLINKGKVVPAFGGLEEACGKTCMDWYAEFYNENWPRADFQNVSLGDLGNGKYRNPLIAADFPDPDVIRVGDTYYMVSTTMHHFPGATILKSKDLVNWNYCAQPLTQLSTTDRYQLLNGQNAYAAGMWACSMSYHEGVFYILINGNDAGGWLLTTDDPEGKWQMKKLARSYYDPGMLFDNGKVYVACGNTEIKMCELDEDFNFVQEKTVFTATEMLEGCHLYKKDDYYYIYATYGGWPSGQTVLRSKNIFGPYEEKMLVEKYINGKPNTVHQGALIETEAGAWWTIMQEDLGALGRFPNMQPVKWVSDWPVIGNDGALYTACAKPVTSVASPRQPLPTNDNFRSYPLGMQWQWNHHPDDGSWSLFERPGWMRLSTSGTAQRLTQARNMLTQRIFAFDNKPSIGTVRMDVSQLQEGDVAGICIFQDPYAMLSVQVKDGKQYLVWRQDTLRTSSSFTPAEKRIEIQTDSIIYLRASISYSTSKTRFYYSFDNVTYQSLGGETTLGYNLSVFVGARFGLYCYATRLESEGYADFDWFSTEEKFDEATYYPATFEGYSADMLTAESMTLSGGNEMEIMIGNRTPIELMVTFRDGHTENVAAQARYVVQGADIIDIQNGQVGGLAEGIAQVKAIYTDLMGNELEETFNVRSTFFPFAKEFINTSLFANGVYTESTRTFRPGQWGQMGWEYPNGADMSGYKYLVIKLKQTQSCDAHLNLFTTNSIWGDCCEVPAFGAKKQIIFNLKTAKYSSGNLKGKALDTKNIRIVSFWSNGSGNIVVDDMYLTNNSDYSRPSGMEEIVVDELFDQGDGLYYNLLGQPIEKPTKGIYIRNGKKIVVK